MIEESDVACLDATIDQAQGQLSPLTTFVLPGGSPAASALHLARAVMRRAERRLVALSSAERVRRELVAYVNRASDLLFVLARRANHIGGICDAPWSADEGRQSST